jgi:hypothetical protein
VGGGGGCDDGGPSTAAADMATSERATGGEFGESGGRQVGFSLAFPRQNSSPAGDGINHRPLGGELGRGPSTGREAVGLGFFRFL